MTNGGPDDATDVTLTDTLPGSVTFVSATPNQGSCSGTSTVTCHLGTLANGASATVTIVTTATTAGTVTNTASVTGNESDLNTANDTATEGTIIGCPDPITAINDPIATVQSLGLDKGTTNSLIAKLTAARRSLEKGNTTAAKGQLTAFINQVSALRGKKIPAPAADNLIAQAQAILNCLP